MGCGYGGWIWRLARTLLAVLLCLSVPIEAGAQESGAEDRSTAVHDVLVRIARDPTTYVPAVMAYTATRLDWKSSQVFFEHGFLEHNPRFTLTGFPDSVPVGYGEGNRLILVDALVDVEVSCANNVTSALVERWLNGRYPEHRRLVRTIGWAERIAFGAYLTNARASSHFRQWRENTAQARAFGFE